MLITDSNSVLILFNKLMLEQKIYYETIEKENTRYYTQSNLKILRMNQSNSKLYQKFQS